jgi:hypothetical protein
MDDPWISKWLLLKSHLLPADWAKYQYKGGAWMETKEDLVVAECKNLAEVVELSVEAAAALVAAKARKKQRHLPTI